MGGWGSGRSGGRPVKEEAKTVDLAMMMRKGWIGEGRSSWGTLNWSVGDRPAGSISYRCDMRDPDNASITLSYRHQRYGEER